MDLLCFAEHIAYQSRDKIVPPINGSIYTIKQTWQQTYRWSTRRPPEVNKTSPLTSKELNLLSEIHLIHKRFVNWFADQNVSVSQYRGNVLERWKHIIVDGLQNAKRYLKIINVTMSKDGIITGSPLFMKRSQFGHFLLDKGRNKKMGNVSFYILFPLTLEYFFTANLNNIHHSISRELANINSLGRREFAVKRIVNFDLQYSKLLYLELKKYKIPLTQSDLRRCLRNLNRKKLDTILLLIRYITDQGWAEGSAMGSLDHALNNVGDGYMNSMFLLKNALLNEGMLDKIVKIMKWHNDFNEIYQKKFEYTGTTADKLRTTMVYRLQTILMNPERNIKEKREKIRDMFAYVRWCNNVLLSHPALLPTFKPDGSCFHHLCIYGPAYCPEALIKSSTVYYYLQGTSFSLDSNSKMNIRRSLMAYIKMAPKYSLPNSISGRFPGYFKATLVTMLPAYAFLTIKPRYLSPNGQLEAVLPGNDTELLRYFVRLYDPENPKVLSYLQSAFVMRVSYSSTIGSLQILESLHRQLKNARIIASEPPSGHWVHNFAAFSIHRRREWVVTIKGFSQHVWNFESSSYENVYGMFQSHGALQISNDEASLAAYDVSRGWDWTRVPGTTAINFSLDEMFSRGFSRFYQNSTFVGGVVLTGEDEKLANGVFTMKFHRHKEIGEEDMFGRREIGFFFNKSIFFFDSLIVCLGDEITTKNSEPYLTQTTLLQNEYLSEISAIFINGEMNFLYKNLTKTVQGPGTIMDTLGNGYYIPHGRSVNVEINEQRSRTENGKSVSKSRYATVWFNHGVNPSSQSYEYAILVGTNIKQMNALLEAQASTLPLYEVLLKNSAVHMVRFTDTLGIVSERSPGYESYGYSFFDASVTLNQGPIVNVSDQCVVMAEIDSSNYSSLNLSVCSPDRNYNSTLKPRQSTKNGVNEYFYMISQPVKVSVDISQPVTLHGVLVNGKPISPLLYSHYILVVPSDPQQPSCGGKRIVFQYLVDGESVEAALSVVNRSLNV
ncbi:chondroitin sulfate ABC exolyase-like [Xenia sp. Carnegie-2017]|uniref:chondroitin sulfate ABC exolyase-like n=1 Tax=Xenia sp. Carnegie-2017 TaxID=2897299 RepID=UPI001F0356E4|nr:chondroitin sulfate ABC exolyase-like [Xenia sp. Carnegie-2017]XP_046854677.1 chondroitin sulfate ABC exolyase-like [Xenia sp. Carnegie-2017]